MRSTLSAFAVLVTGALLLPGSLRAQVATLDQGTFVIERNGQQIGTETFTVRSSGFGQNRRIFAEATLEITAPASERATARAALLTEGPAQSIRVYELAIDGTEALQLKLEARGDRFRTEVTRGPRIQEREFRARSAGTAVILLDRLMSHQYFFVGRLLRNGSPDLSVVMPQDLVQRDGSLEEVGTESVTVGRQSLQATHLRLTLADEVHHIWLDVQNRVLRVEIPDRGVVAVRRAPPE